MNCVEFLLTPINEFLAFPIVLRALRSNITTNLALSTLDISFLKESCWISEQASGRCKLWRRLFKAQVISPRINL